MLKIIKMSYHGIEITQFIDKIYKAKNNEINLLNQEIEQLKQQIEYFKKQQIQNKPKTINYKN